MTAPALRYPDFTQEFIVTTDVSAYAIGAVLSQGKRWPTDCLRQQSTILGKAELQHNRKRIISHYEP